MIKRLVIGILTAGVLAALALSVWAAWVTPHTTSGSVSTATADDDLYICRPAADLPECPIDVLPGPDELIFEGDEQMGPGDVRWEKIRVKNVSTTRAWDISGMVPTWTPQFPEPLCPFLPEGAVVPGGVVTPVPLGPGVTILGKPVPGGGGAYADAVNDNHPGPSLNFEVFIPTSPPLAVHVEPGDYEDLQLGIRLSELAPIQCAGLTWSLSIQWDVEPHVDP